MAYSSTTLGGFETEVYGFIRANGIYATEALASFNNINMVAPTHVVPDEPEKNKVSRASIQTQQSRVGFNMKKGDNLSAKLEFDFVDFSKSSPTVQSNPRVRIASVTYVKDNHKFIVGQDWDLFSPVAAFTYNYIGNYFMAGNVGFMRQQFQYLNTQGQMEYAAAVGMPGNNPGVTDADLELAKSPSYSVRMTKKLELGRVGISAIYARIHYQLDQSTHDSYAGNIFYEQMIGRITFKSEAYFGQNLNNIGALGIGKGINTSDVQEYGGHLTASYNLDEKSYIFGGVGTAIVDQPSDVAAYTVGATGIITSPGILRNLQTKLGYEYKVTPDFSVIGELTRYETKIKEAADSDVLAAYSMDAGIQLRF